MKNFYFIRHGETNSLVNNVVQDFDTPLSENGVLQVRNTINYLASIQIDKILCSPLLRTKQTAQIINEVLKKEIMYLDELEEERRPSIIRGKSKKDPEVRKVLDEIDLNYANPTYRYSDEDTFELLKARVLKLRSVLENLKDGNYLVVTHGVLRRLFLAVVLFGEDIPANAFINFNNAVIIDRVALYAFKLENNKVWKLSKWNESMLLK